MRIYRDSHGFTVDHWYVLYAKPIITQVVIDKYIDSVFLYTKKVGVRI